MYHSLMMQFYVSCAVTMQINPTSRQAGVRTKRPQETGYAAWNNV
jgi:hypothetical protein